MYRVINYFHCATPATFIHLSISLIHYAVCLISCFKYSLNRQYIFVVLKLLENSIGL